MATGRKRKPKSDEAPASENKSTTQNLRPIPRRTVRVVLVVLLALLAVIGSTAWHEKLVFVLVMTLMIGTWRQFRVSEKTLKQRWTVGFVPLGQRQWKLRRYTKLETRYDPATGILEFLLFGPVAFIYGWISDTFFPWVGGTYQIWLNDESDEGVLAWQGNSQGLFEENLEVLKVITGLPVTAR